jgi:hypothetical protein
MLLDRFDSNIIYHILTFLVPNSKRRNKHSDFFSLTNISKQLFLSGIMIRHRFVSTQLMIKDTLNTFNQNRKSSINLLSISRPGSMIEFILLRHKEIESFIYGRELYTVLSTKWKSELELKMYIKTHNVNLLYLCYSNYRIVSLCRKNRLNSVNLLEIYSCIYQTMMNNNNSWWGSVLIVPSKREWISVYIEIVEEILQFPLPNIPIAAARKGQLLTSLQLYKYREKGIKIVCKLFEFCIMIYLLVFISEFGIDFEN